MSKSFWWMLVLQVTAVAIAVADYFFFGWKWWYHPMMIGFVGLYIWVDVQSVRSHRMMLAWRKELDHWDAVWAALPEERYELAKSFGLLRYFEGIDEDIIQTAFTTAQRGIE